MKLTNQSSNRWEKAKLFINREPKSSCRFYCDRCKNGFNNYDEFDEHTCAPGRTDIEVSE